MDALTAHYLERANPDLPRTNEKLRALICAHEFENALVLATRMSPKELMKIDERQQTILHVLAVQPECDQSVGLMRVLASKTPTVDILHRDQNGHTAADMAFFSGGVQYQRLLQTFQRYPLSQPQQETVAPSL
ncbi:MAG: hypothetical protein V4621_01855 [Pseudomonadota bacterium]